MCSDFPEVKNNRDNIIAVLVGGKSFSPDFEKGLRQCNRDGLTGTKLFAVTRFPVELRLEEAYKQN